MSDIFISHVQEDARVALTIAFCLEHAGFKTWCYEIDSAPGPSYLIQTGQAIEQAKAIILIISENSLGSHQVTREVVRAHECEKYFIPLRLNVSHEEFQTRAPEWREVLAASTSIEISPQDIYGVIPRLISGLKALRIKTTRRSRDDHISRIKDALSKIPETVPVSDSRSPSLTIPAGKIAVPRQMRPAASPLRRNWPKIVATLAAIAVLLATIYWQRMRQTEQSPSSTSEESSIEPYVPASLEDLLRDLRDSRFEVQISAAEAFHRFQTPEAAEKVAAILRADSRVEVQVAASRALVKIGTPAVEPLCLILKDKQLMKVARYAAARTLGEIGDSRAVASLMKVLTEDSDVQGASTLGLIDIGSQAVEPLIGALKSTNARLRERAGWILVKIGDVRAASPLLEAVRKGDVAVVAGAYRFVIANGITGSEPLLIRGLNEYADITLMAEEFVNSGNETLSRAAIAWATKQRKKLEGKGETIHWGQGGRFSLQGTEGNLPSAAGEVEKPGGAWLEAGSSEEMMTSAKRFLENLARGQPEAQRQLPLQSDTNKIIVGLFKSLSRYPFPIHRVTSLRYDSDSRTAVVELEIAEISYVCAAAAGEYDWRKLPNSPHETIQSRLAIGKQVGQVAVDAGELGLLMVMAADLARWQRESNTPITLKRFPALQTYVLYAKACGLNDDQMKLRLAQVQSNWVEQGWNELLRTE